MLDDAKLTPRTLLALALGVLVGAGPALHATALGPMIGIAAVLGVTLLVVRYWGRGDRALYVVLLVAFGARVAVLSLDAALGLFPKNDAIFYHFRSATLAESWWSGADWQHMNNVKTFAYEIVVAPLYYWFGSSPLLARTVNAALATGAAYNVFRVGRELYDRRTALAATGAFAILPSIVRIHGEHLREALVVLLITEVVYVLVADRWRRPAGAAVLAYALGHLYFLRQPTLLVLLVPVVLLAARAVGVRRSGWWTGRKAVVAAAGAVVVVAALLVLSGVQLPYEQWLDPKRLASFRDEWATGGSQYLADRSFATWLDVARFLPVGGAYFLWTPFPWQVHTQLALAAALENLLLFYPLTVLALPGLWNARHDGRRAALAVLIAVAAGVYGLVEGNVGTALRHRAQFTWVLFVFAGPTVAWAWRRLAGSPAPGSGLREALERRLESGG